MIAQDTGSAIVGPARADLYLGAGDEAGRIAGRIRLPGRFAMLLPRELDMVAAGREMPLPVPKPKIAGVDVGKQAGKGKADPAGSGASRHMPVPTTKKKIAESEARKQDGKGCGVRRLRRARGRPAYAVVGAKTEDPRDRSQETGTAYVGGLR